MSNLFETLVKKTFRQLWDVELRDAAVKCPSEQYLQYEFHSFYPKFVFVELDKEELNRTFLNSAQRRMREMEGRGEITEEEVLENRRRNYVPGSKMAFLTNEEQSNINLGEVKTVKWMTLVPRMRPLVREYLRRRRPTPAFMNGIEGWILPLYLTDIFQSVEDYNEYMHSIMFWECAIDGKDVGPIMQRYAWVTKRLYDHASEFELLKQKVWREFPETRDKQMNTLQKVVDAIVKGKFMRRQASVLDERSNGQIPMFPDIERQNKLERLKVEIMEANEKLTATQTRKEASERRLMQMQNDIEFFSARSEELQGKLAQLNEMYNELIQEQDDSK